MEQQVNVAQVLRHNTSDLRRPLALPTAPMGASYQRGKKLCVEPAGALDSQVVMGGGGLVAAQELRLKSVLSQTLVDVLSFHFELGWQGDIGIERCQRRVVQHPCRGMKAVKSVRPS